MVASNQVATKDQPHADAPLPFGGIFIDGASFPALTKAGNVVHFQCVARQSWSATSNYTELLFLSLIFGLLFRFLDFAICSSR